jgi:hypothetical protein
MNLEEKQLNTRTKLVWALFWLGVALIVGGTFAWLFGRKGLGQALFSLAGAEVLVWVGYFIVGRVRNGGSTP